MDILGSLALNLSIEIKCTYHPVKVRTKDDCQTIAKIQFKIVRLPEDQAKSGKASGFTKGCANVGFADAGAHGD